ncbi:TonB-dependent receptor [Bryobacter aggregatus]|uniref:TonB-dependent receptor n=1 Tax=Bryobacter aggregatus TaxID=360054 RepID=UPI0004E0B165|nr:TonB-dependent receptor [Bryobacter aggregatus]
MTVGKAPAQLSNASIKGTVADSSGGSVPQANVELTNSGTGEKRQSITRADGRYEFVALPPGEYRVKTTAAGFAEWAGKLTLRVAQEAVVDQVLQTGSVSTSVLVEDVTPVISAESSDLSDVKEASRISALPLQNRNFQNILNFTPGVVAGGFAGQGAAYTRVNGIPGGSVDYLVDGMTATERYTNELQRLPQSIPTIQEIKVSTSNANAEYSRPGMVEVVTKSGGNQFHGQLFELIQNSKFAAKSYRQQQVNFLVRNEFGGNFSGPVWIPKLYDGRNKTFFFFDLEGIRQRSAQNERYTVPTAAMKQGDFSGYTDEAGNQIRLYDPLSTRLDPATGSYVRTPFAGNRVPTDRMNAAGRKVVGYLPDPTNNVLYYQGWNYQNPNARLRDDKRMLTSKLDQVFGTNRLSGRYTNTDNDNFGVGYFLNPNTRKIGGHNAALSFTQLISPAIVNEIRGGVQRFRAYRGPQVLDPPITQTLGLPTYPGSVAWPSFCFGDDWTSSGYFECIDRDNPQDAPVLTLNFADNLSWTRGKHEMKFGVFVQRSAANSYETGQPGGDYNFSGNFTSLMDPSAASKGIMNQRIPNTGAGLADLLLGYTDSSTLNQYPRFYTRQTNYSFFAQDNWRVSRRLTLNLGLRYEYWTPFADKRDQISNLNLNTPGGPTVVYPGGGSITKQGFPQNVVDGYLRAGLKLQSAEQAGFASSLWNMPKANFAPRLGVAYSMGKTVVRGAYGIYYWAMPLVQYHQNTRRNAPYSYSFQSFVDNNDSVAASLAFPAGAAAGYQNQSPNARNLGNAFLNPSALNIQKNNGFSFLPWEQNYKAQMAQEWNVTIERELPGRFGSRLSYVGTHSSNLPNYDPINALVPRLLSPAGATTPERRAYADFATSSLGSASAMNLLRFVGYANSNQFQAEVKRRFENGFVIQGFYTYQKTLTTSEGSNNSFSNLQLLPAALTKNASMDSRLRSIYGNDSALPRHTLSFNSNYELPFGKGKKFLGNANGVVDRLVSGWNASGFFYKRSGLFFSPYYSVGGSSTILAPGKDGILPKDQRAAERWFNPSINRADQGVAYNGETYIRRANTLENDYLNYIPRSYMTGPGFYNIDTSFYKITPITERVKFRLEAQIFNLLNHKNLGLPNTAGVITAGVGLPRLVQFQGRLDF